MTISSEHMRILKMIESGRVTAEEGSRLIEALGESSGRERASAGGHARTLRVRVIDLNNRRQKINVTIPVSLVEIGLKLGARLAPRVTNVTGEDILRAIESGATGRIFEMQDLDEAERVEIYVE